MSEARKVTISWTTRGWQAKVRGEDALVASSVAELGRMVRGIVGDRAWVWKLDLGEDTDYYIDLTWYHHDRLRNGLLSNEKGRAQLVEAVWALRLNDASPDDCAELCGVPLAWIHDVWAEAVTG